MIKQVHLPFNVFISCTVHQKLPQLLSFQRKTNNSKVRQNRGRQTLWTLSDLAYREKEKKKGIIATGSLRLPAVIARILTQSLRSTLLVCLAPAVCELYIITAPQLNSTGDLLGKKSLLKRNLKLISFQKDNAWPNKRRAKWVFCPF